MPKIKSEDNEPKNNSEKSNFLNTIFGFFILTLIFSVTIFLHKISIG